MSCASRGQWGKGCGRGQGCGPGKPPPLWDSASDPRLLEERESESSLAWILTQIPAIWVASKILSPYLGGGGPDSWGPRGSARAIHQKFSLEESDVILVSSYFK